LGRRWQGTNVREFHGKRWKEKKLRFLRKMKIKSKIKNGAVMYINIT
jgi:hypothetical protein